MHCEVGFIGHSTINAYSFRIYGPEIAINVLNSRINKKVDIAGCYT